MEIKNYNPGDETAILKLFKESFKKDMPLTFWQWRFINNPLNKIMIKLMWDNEKLVGHYAVSPVYLSVDGKKILSALSMTTMTHPDYGGKGIFTDLAEALYTEENLKSGLNAVWGFPNNNSHYGFIKNLKWKNLEQIPTFSLNVSKLKTGSFEKFNILNEFTDENINTYNKLTSGFSIKVLKSKEYFRWRYLENPINTYDTFQFTSENASFFAITKAYITKPIDKEAEIDIVELAFPADLKLLQNLIFSIIEYYKNKNLLIKKINCWLPLHDDRHILLEKIGFINEVPITYFGIRTFETDSTILNNAHNWAYSMGESDIY